MIQSLLVGQGGTVRTFFTGRRPASCTVSLVLDDGTLAIAAQPCMVDPVNTTISAAVAAGDFDVPVTSNLFIVPRQRYLLGDEELTIKAVSANVVELWAPLVRDHAAGSAFQGLGITYVVDPSVTTEVWWDGQAVFTPDVGDAQTEVVDCVRRALPDLLISEIDIRKIVPKMAGALSAELDVLTAFADARDNMLMDIGGRDRAETILGVDHFRRLCAYRFWLDRAAEFGDEWAAQMAKIQNEYDRLKALVITEAPQGADDGTATTGAGTGAIDLFNMDYM